MKSGSISYAVILARSGSKSIKDKNITDVLGKPLISYAIEEAKKSKKIRKIFVLTDSNKYKNIFLKMNVEVPFLRPKSISTNNSRDIDTFYYFYKWLIKKKIELPDYFIHLRATAPLISYKDINQAIKIIDKNKKADSLKSINESNISPYKMWKIAKDGFMKPILRNTFGIFEPWNSSRHLLPAVYWQNAQIDIVKSNTLKRKTMSGKNILPYIIKNKQILDIDNPIDLLDLETRINLNKNIKEVVIDIDGVVASLRKDLNYKKAKPIKKNINLINKLYSKGIKIKFNTARGSETGENWKKYTIKQLKFWDIKFHEIHFGKPNGDIYIDDKSLTPSSLLLLKSK